jgi:hypothetical protein
MRISIDAPGPQSPAFSGIAQFGGWALDDNGPISGVQISVDGVSLGAASYGGTRSDVCNAFPGRAGCPNVGWNVLVDTGVLSNGTHTLAVTAITANGQSSTNTASFTVAN